MISFIEYVKIFGLPALIWAIVVFCAYKKLPRLNINPIFLIFAYLLLKALLIVFIYLDPFKIFKSEFEFIFAGFSFYILFALTHYLLFGLSTLILLFLFEKTIHGIFKTLLWVFILLDCIFVFIGFIPLNVLYIIKDWPSLR